MNANSRFVRFSSKEGNPSLFWLTPDESQSPIFRLIGRDLGVVCLRAPQIDSTKPPPTLRQMAAFYADSIVAAGCSRGVALAGYCIAAVLVREVAIELDGRGIAVHSLVMVDPPDPALSRSAVTRDSWSGRIVSLFWRVEMHVRRLMRVSPLEAWKRIQASVAGIRRRISYQRSRIDYRNALAAKTAAQQTNVFMLSVGAYLNTSLEIYRGSAWLVRPEDAPKGAYKNADRRWQECIAGRLSVVTVPGNTSTMWQEPAVTKLAQCFKSCLE